jgi:hypothetical protein
VGVRQEGKGGGFSLPQSVRAGKVMVFLSDSNIGVVTIRKRDREKVLDFR